jgi:hypothetical protein
MNIFVLDLDHYLNAKYHVDKHIVKMPLEAAQLMSTVSWIDDYFGYTPRPLDSAEAKVLKLYLSGLELDFWADRYAMTHYNHPCSIWARTSAENYQWLYEYAMSLGNEYTNRYGKWHKSTSVALHIPEPQALPTIGLTPFAQAMPDQYKGPDTVKAYRDYYKAEKRHIAEWKRGVPDWWQ